MSAYSPFDKELRDLQSEDLASLKQASEGWYIEYKKEIPNASGIAKSLSAFANTYGGWLFLGVEEESKENPVAGTFPGIARPEVDAALQRMRKSAADMAIPSPYYEPKVLWGPVSAIGLPEDRAIICVWIPQSSTAPHIHKRGVIYRRVSDASEPQAENDRFVLDQLWRRADDLRQRYKEWYDRDPEFSDNEKSKPYVRLMLVADRWAQRDVWIDSDDDQIRTLLGVREGILSAIPFDTVYTSAEGFIGRQLTGNDPYNLTLTWRLRRNLLSDVVIPLPLYEPTNLAGLETELNGYDNVHHFIHVLNRYNITNIRVVDLNYLFNILAGVANIQRRLCALGNWSEPYHFKVKVLNAWRTIPFVDIPAILDGFESHGPPMCLDSTASFPGGTGPENFVEVENYGQVKSDYDRDLIQAFLMFAPMALAFGIPPWIKPNEESTVTLHYDEALQQAGQRALDVQRTRNERLRRET